MGMESVFYRFETLKFNIMTKEKKEDIQLYIDNCNKKQLTKMVSDKNEQIIKLQQQVKNCYIPDVKPRFWSVVEKRGQVFHEVKSYKRKKDAINLLIKLKSKSLTDYNLVSILIGDNT